MSDLVEVLAKVAGEHQARWWTHGDVRLYDVLHCTARDCDWSLRQKVSMSEDACYEAHRQHFATEQAAALAGWVTFLSPHGATSETRGGTDG